MAAEITITGAGGEYMETVTVVAWHVEPGARVRAGDPLVTVETAKSATEIEAPVDGTLIAVNAGVGDEVPVGASLGRIGNEADAGSGPAPAEAREAPAQAPAQAPASESAAPKREGKARVIASPLARRIARQLGVDLESLTGTGPGNRIKRRDVESAARAQPAPAGTMARRSAPIVMLHGIGASSAIWLPVIADLDPAVVVERLDLPGHGGAAALERPGLAALVDAVWAQLEAAGIGEAHLVGHSLGGALALALADAGRLRVRSLTLLAPAGLGPEIDGAFLAGFARATRTESLSPWLARLVADPAVLPGGFAEETMRMRSPSEVREGQERLIEALFPDGTQSFDLRPALGRLRVPGKLIWGRQDAIIPWRHALAAPGRVGLHLLADAGHLVQLEAPDVVAALVSEAVRSASWPSA